MPQIDAASPDRPRLADHARRVHPFTWKLLTGFLVLAVACTGLYAYAFFTRPAPRSDAAVAAPRGSSGFVGSGGAANASGDGSGEASRGDSADAPAATDSWSGWAGAKGATLGFGFVGGFVIGFIFRAFLKLMTLVTLIVIGGLTLLSYYHVLNIDFTHARDAVQSNAQWLTEQATRLKDVLVAHLPSSTGGAAGVFFGLRRR